MCVCRVYAVCWSGCVLAHARLSGLTDDDDDDEADHTHTHAHTRTLSYDCMMYDV